ncbi:MAG: alpha/beta hydrolase fold protein [Myxococcaceae bacterium]|nr:alpha/beta hydrolase fold protein [Myxococcaceae bacterium]
MSGRLALLGLLACTSGCLSFHRGAMPGEPASATYVNLGDTRVRYLDVGKGPAVVLIHGFASSLETWGRVVPVLAKTHRVLALDLKGFGWTDRPEGDYSPHAQAQLVSALMEERGIESAVIVAHSWGSSIALDLALTEPAKVTRLALYDAWVYEEQLPSFFHLARASGIGEILFGLFYDQRPDERLAQAFFEPQLLSEQLVEDVERALERPGTRAAALAAARGQRFASVQDEYRKILVPTLLLWGREDRVTTLAVGERLSRELPQSRLVVYPRCGHFPMLEAAAASTDELQKFIVETEPHTVVIPIARGEAR